MVSPSAARTMQATRAQLFRQSFTQRAGFVNRENRVPYYQRLFQNHDGKRQWWKTPRSAMIMIPYYVLFSVSLTASLWGTFRVMFGHKTFYGS